VPDARLESANSTLISLERLGQDLVGPALAGLLFVTSPLLPFGLNALGLALSVALLIGITTAPPGVAMSRATGAGARDDKDSGKALRETLAGMRWLWGAVFVRRLILTGAALTFITMFWESTLVLLALGPIGVSEAGYGLILSIGAIGGVLGAIATPRLVHAYDRWLLQLTGLGMCAMVNVALAVWPSAVTAAIAWGGTGFGFAIWNVVSISTRQRLVPGHLLARVNSAARTISMSAVPLGALAGGVTADLFGLRAPIATSAVALVALLVVYAILSRHDRRHLAPPST
jgi:hypothetical protein